MRLEIHIVLYMFSTSLVQVDKLKIKCMSISHIFVIPLYNLL